jgi:hypothetical protein
VVIVVVAAAAAVDGGMKMMKHSIVFRKTGSHKKATSQCSNGTTLVKILSIVVRLATLLLTIL